MFVRMRREWAAFFILLVFCNPLWAVDDSSNRIHHDLVIKINPSKSAISVTDKISLPSEVNKELTFLLDSRLEVSKMTGGAIISQHQHPNSSDLTLYQIEIEAGEELFVIEYSGKIHSPLRQVETETREFQQTKGLIGIEGLFLSGISAWYPQFKQKMLTFDLELNLPTGWKGLTQGVREHTKELSGTTQERWRSKTPQEEIYLISAPYQEYSAAADGVTLKVLLRNPDEKLANQYLTASAKYLKLYSSLLGPYPYEKFVVAENFWQSGYGMPSFTLLGDKVIRLPFILYTSLPHEIVHNWWGNGVYMNPAYGNWSEGLTTYLADHLIQEERGKAVLYRRDVLKKYTDFVNVDSGAELALKDFKGRTSPTTEAIGYGKTMMFFHMLRLKMGDEIFLTALKTFFQTYLFKPASFLDLVDHLGKSANQDFSHEFSQWVIQSGAPSIRLSDVSVQTAGNGYRLTFKLTQVQAGDAYLLDVPISITFTDVDLAYQSKVVMKNHSQTYSLKLSKQPIRLDVDPSFDVFRRLDSSEVPPSIGQLMGGNLLAIIPSQGIGYELKEYYEDLAILWGSFYGIKMTVVTDDEVKVIPKNTNVLILDWRNQLFDEFAQSLHQYGENIIAGSSIVIEENDHLTNRDDVILLSKVSTDSEYTIAWAGLTGNQESSALVKRLSHYAKYSYLAFSEKIRRAKLRGQWQVKNSVLARLMQEEDGGTVTSGLKPRPTPLSLSKTK